MPRTLVVIIGLVLVGGGLYIWSSGSWVGSTKVDDTKIGGGVVVSQAAGLDGAYEAYAPEKLMRASAERSVVLFFRADWCPTCRALDADIRSKLETIPQNVSILYLNYDTETALKQKYGVTYQHTLVQVDAEGNQIVKWSKSPTLEDVLLNIK